MRAMTRTRTLRGACAAVLLTVATVPVALGAQAVRGHVVDAVAGAPARGALVTLLGADGGRIAPTLVGEDGAYTVAAPGAGSYRVRVDLIGYETWMSGALAIGPADTLALDVRLPLKRAELAPITVQDEARCETQPQQVPRMLAIWEEIRRALTISDLSTRRGLVPLDLEVVESRRGFGGRTQQVRRRTRSAGSRPWAVRPPAELAARGFVREDEGAFEFVGPDAPILLSSEFVETHCFRSVRRRALFGGGAVGLAFEPVPGRTVPDVQGTIWLDARTSELRTVDFTFVNLTGAMRAAGTAKGSLAFARQPSGAWYVRSWSLELPRGNAARGVAVPVGTLASRRPAAVLRGVVFDSTLGEPLAGAIVHVPGTDSVVTDSLGRFSATIEDLSLDSLDVSVSVEHPRLATLGLASAERTVRVVAGRAVTVDAAVPSVRALMTAFCRRDVAAAVAPFGPPDNGLLLGRATRADGQPLGVDAHVVVEWASDEPLGAGVGERTQQRTVALGTDGAFRACPLPLGRTLRLAIEVGGARGPATEIVLPATGIGQIDLTGLTGRP